MKKKQYLQFFQIILLPSKKKKNKFPRMKGLYTPSLFSNSTNFAAFKHREQKYRSIGFPVFFALRS